MKNLKTLMFGWEFPPRISGGLGVACHAIVQELLKQQIDLTLVLPYALPFPAEEILPPVHGASFTQVPLATLAPELSSGQFRELLAQLHPYSRQLAGQTSKDKVSEYLAMLQRLTLPDALTSLVREELHQLGSQDNYTLSLMTEVFRYAACAGSVATTVEHDVIHVHDWLTILAGLAAKGISGKPLVFHIHALETDRSGMGVNEKIYTIEKYGMQHADRIIAVSQYTKSNIVDRYGIDPARITVVHNGVYHTSTTQAGRENQLPRSKMVLFLGRVTHQKGPSYFVEVAQKVLSRRKDVQFVMAGSGDLLTAMVRRVGELRIGKHVHFVGFLGPSQVQQIYGLADVYVMPSVSEPFGLSALEALSSGVPAVISKQSGVAEVLNHVLAADYWDVDDIAAKILALLDYGVLRTTSVLNTQDDIALLTWEKAARKIIDIYNLLLV